MHIDLEGSERIGEGRYRQVLCQGDFVLKFLKPCVNKQYGPLQLHFPAGLYTACKFGIPDFNQHEYAQYQRIINALPQESHDNLAHIHYVTHHAGHSVSVSDLVRDSDNTPSHPLSDYPGIASGSFWEQLDGLENALREYRIPLMDIKGENILVQKNHDGARPVLMDYKRHGSRTYPFQAWMSEEQQLERMSRRFQRVRDQYQPAHKQQSL